MASTAQAPGGVQRRSFVRRAGSRTLNFTKSFFSGRHHEAGMGWLKWGFGLDHRTSLEKARGVAAPGFLGRALGLGVTAYSAYEGYQEGGVWGATKEVAKGAAMNYVAGRLWSAAIAPGLKAGAALGVAGLVGAGLYASSEGIAYSQAFRGLARPYLHDHYRKHAKLEMGSPIVDPFGMAATMRQRSVMAIQNSKLNGRGVLGNEAMLMNTQYHR